MDGGGGNPSGVLQLTTLSEDLVYRFTEYGRYTVTVSGSVPDIRGRVYPFAGTYEIVASEGDTYEVVMRPRLARAPLATMAEIREKAVLEGERLKVTTPRGRTETWRRIS